MYLVVFVFVFQNERDIERWVPEKFWGRIDWS